MIPATYDYQNAQQSAVNPSTVHIRNTAIANFFKKYLMQKAMSVFKWTLPKTWSKEYFLYTLYYFGFCAIVETDKFGVIPQQCSLSGFDVFYRPTNAMIANPLIKGVLNPRIGSECVLLKLQPNYSGIFDVVDYYGDMLALCAESIGVNLLNSHLAYVFRAKNKAQSDSYKKMFDQIASGQPCVVVDKDLFNEEKKINDFLTLNVKENYIASDILSDMQKIEAQFDTVIGIPNANTDKRERLITDEVNANNFATLARPSLWLDSLREGCTQVENMFGIKISVDWRDSPHDSVNLDNVQL